MPRAKTKQSPAQPVATGPANRRERQKQETRERIVAAATKQLLREGPEAFSMRKLASQIGLTPTAIYFHFPDREALISEVVERQFLKFRSLFEQAAQTPDPIERLRAMGLAFVQFSVDHPSVYHSLFLVPLGHIPKGRLIQKGNPTQDCYALLHSTVAAAAQDARYQPKYRDTQLLAQVFFAGVHGLAALHLIKGDDDWIQWTDLSERSQAMVDGLIAGLFHQVSPHASAAHRPAPSGKRKTTNRSTTPSQANSSRSRR